ncbi:MAG TPA: cytochrome c oxidase assembly factor Coa1 family protein [Pyrinomonadaceae bacterium]|nr:cytochrome c oxidase assembly factor Coa1 family protein [Pyrinomonadaceae bacterium]
MTTKRIVILVGVAVVAVGFLVVLFVGGIVGFALYTVGNSEAAVTAKEFLRTNQRLKDDIGEVQDFGRFVSGSVNVHNSNGDATISLKVIGERRTVNATVGLAYRDGRPWRVVSASYLSEAGRTIDLIHAYEAQQQLPLLTA